MRVSTVAICTLAALVAREVPNRVSAATYPQIPDWEPDNRTWMNSVGMNAPDPVLSVTPPETLASGQAVPSSAIRPKAKTRLSPIERAALAGLEWNQESAPYLASTSSAAEPAWMSRTDAIAPPSPLSPAGVTATKSHVAIPQGGGYAFQAGSANANAGENKTGNKAGNKALNSSTRKIVSDPNLLAEMLSPEFGINLGTASSTTHLTAANLTATTQISRSVLPSSPDEFAQAVWFADVEGHWAQNFIEVLAGQGIMQGFLEDQSFRPDAPITRAEFAATIRRAFQQPSIRNAPSFLDVSASHWASSAIQSAYEMGFLNGHSNRRFAPDQPLARVEALVALAEGINLAASPATMNKLNALFSDEQQIPRLARDRVAAVASQGIVVNHPSVRRLNPNQIATRADIAAFLHQALVAIGQLSALPADTIASQYIAAAKPTATPTLIASQPPVSVPSREEIETLQTQLKAQEDGFDFGDIYRGSPALTISNPSGFGAHRNIGFINFGYQSRTRFSSKDDGTLGLGVGLGDAQRAVGLQLSYTLASFGDNRDFGTGGFNAKLHRQLPDGWSLAAGWEGFASTVDDTDFANTIYGSATKVFRTRERVSDSFSRVALTGGIGSGRFRPAEDIDDDVNSVNVFGSLAVRIAQPLSGIVEWTGQDLAFGFSIVPIRNVPWVITPAVRDIVGAGDGPRFVLGTGFSFKF